MQRSDSQSNGDQRPIVSPPAPGTMVAASSTLLDIVLRRRWTIAFLTLLTLAAGFAYVMKATPIYTSTSRLYVEQAGPRIIGEREVLAAQSKNYLYTQVEILASTPILTEVAENPTIRQMKTFDRVDNLVAFLKSELDVDVGSKDDIISVAMDSPYSEEAAAIVNAAVDAYVNYNATRKRSTATEVLKILQKEKDSRDKEFAAKNKAILDFKIANPALTIQDERGTNAITQTLSRLSLALADARIATIMAKASYEAAQLMLGDPERMKQFAQVQLERGVRISMEQERTQTTAELTDLQLQLDDLQAYATPDHPLVQTVEKQIRRLKAEIEEQDARTASNYLEIARQQWEAAQQTEAELDSEFKEQTGKAQEVNTKSAELAIMVAEKDRIEKLLDIIDSRIKELNVTEDTGALNISILEAARPEEKPSKPQKARILAIALVLGLMLGFGTALLVDWMDHRLRSADEISAILAVPVLGIVPSMPSKESRTERGQKAYRKPTSNIAEAYRTIRTAVYFGVAGGGARTILVTSPAPGDGKSTMASNLAITMAQAGQRTLLLDADFRKPVVHEIFECDNAQGLSSVLSGQLLLADAIQPSPVPGLDLLPCGPVPPNPSELLNSDAFADLLKKLEDHYDRIILDSPPVMPVTDARILGALVDTTLLVLRAERSTRRASEQARDGLLSVGTRILGVVVNDVPRRKERYGYYSGGYGYYGGYGGYGHYGRYGQGEDGGGKAGESRRSVREPKEVHRA